MNARFRLRSWPLAAVLLVAGVAHSQFLETVIPVGDTPTDLLWNPVGDKVYCANEQSGTVTVINGATNQVLTTVDVADHPVALSWNSVGNKVYCVCLDPDWLYVLDGVGDTVIRRVRMRGAPTRMVFNAQMNKLYVICYDDQMVRVYDGSADTLAAEVWLGSTPGGTLLWHPASNRVFSPVWWYPDEDSLVVLDCATDVIAERRPTGPGPYAMCWNPVNNLVYVCSGQGIHVLTASGDSTIALIPAYSDDMSFAPCPNKLLAVSDVATVIDCDSNFIKTSLSVGGSAVKVDTFHGKAYCTNVYAGAVYVIDMRGDSLLKTIALGRYPLELCWNQTNSRAYIADHMDDVVYVVRDTSVGVREHSEKRIAFLLRRASLVGWQSLVARGLEGTLRDASGRDVARLPSGTGSLCELRAGVYFLQPVGQATACKVVLQK